jgi:LysM repeat protein
LGIRIDAQASAQAAHDYGRSDGSMFDGLGAIFGKADVAPVLDVNIDQAEIYLRAIANQIEIPPRNAGVQLVNGQVQPTAPVEGRILDVNATLQQIQQNAGELVADGRLELVMIPIAPTVTDSSALVAQASQLLANPLNIQGYDPIKDEWHRWPVPSQEWSQWLVASNGGGTGLSLSLDATALTNYLKTHDTALNTQGLYLKVDEATTQVQQAVQGQNTSPIVRVYHHPQQHTVQSGETVSSIAYDYGVPYPWIQQANPTLGDALSVGQTVIIPSLDEFIPLSLVPHKRIVVNISQQKMWAYENGQVKWTWTVSTGIPSSPTWPGVYQIQSHEELAYAGNWNLWMPHFMGVYRPVPTSEFMNGFHGFPSRNGSQLLWTSNLGTRVTYGCILVSSDNATQLYSWAEEGVVVEIQR